MIGCVWKCWMSGKQCWLIRRRVLWRLIWVYTFCSGLSVRIRRVSTVIRTNRTPSEIILDPRLFHFCCIGIYTCALIVTVWPKRVSLNTQILYTSIVDTSGCGLITSFSRTNKSWHDIPYNETGAVFWSKKIFHEGSTKMQETDTDV